MKKVYWIEWDEEMLNPLGFLPAYCKITPAETLSRSKVEEILREDIKENKKYIEEVMRVQLIRTRNTEDKLVDKIMELVVDDLPYVKHVGCVDSFVKGASYIINIKTLQQRIKNISEYNEKLHNDLSEMGQHTKHLKAKLDKAVEALKRIYIHASGESEMQIVSVAQQALDEIEGA